MLSMVLGVVSVAGDSTSTLPLNVLPVTTTISYDYDYVTGVLTPGTLVATDIAFGNTLSTTTADPSPHSNGGGTFFGTARPIHFQDDEVVYTASVCSPYPSCSSSLTFGGFVITHHFNGPLSSLTTLASQYYIPAPSDCSAGSPRFSLTTSEGTNHNIFVYFGPPPSFTGCAADTWANPDSGENFATNVAGPRWDLSQLTTFNPVACPPSYTVYSVALSCAAALGLTINAIFVVIDSGWNGPATSGTGTQIVYFRSLQVNSETRFP